MTQAPNLLSSLENYLRLSSERQRLIATNMANIDTPGYHSSDIDFESEMRKVVTASENTTALTPVVRRTQGLMERPDGNNVDIDRESLHLSETQLQYQLGVQLLKHQFHGLLSAISGGN
jgi:flagellar basal-body rod protein FlgB